MRERYSVIILSIFFMILAGIIGCKTKKAPKRHAMKKARVAPAPVERKSVTRKPVKVDMVKAQPIKSSGNAIKPDQVFGVVRVTSLEKAISSISSILARLRIQKMSPLIFKASVASLIGLASFQGVEREKEVRVYLAIDESGIATMTVFRKDGSAAVSAKKGYFTIDLGAHVAIIKGSFKDTDNLKAYLIKDLKRPMQGGLFHFDLFMEQTLALVAEGLGTIFGKTRSSASQPVHSKANILLTLLKMIETVSIDLDVVQNDIRGVLKLGAKPGSGLARFLRGIEPSTQPLLSKVARKAPLLLAADIPQRNWRILAEGVMGYLKKTQSQNQSLKEKRDFEEMEKSLNRWLKYMKGDLLLAVDPDKGMSFYGLFGMSNNPEGNKLLKAMANLINSLVSDTSGKQGMKVSTSYQVGAGKHAGMTYDRMTVKTVFSKAGALMKMFNSKFFNTDSKFFLALVRKNILWAGGKGATKEAIHGVIDRMVKPNNDNITQNPDFKATLSRLPSNRFAVFYIDIVSFIKRGLQQFLSTLPGMLGAVKGGRGIGGTLGVVGGVLQIDLLVALDHLKAIATLFSELKKGKQELMKGFMKMNTPDVLGAGGKLDISKLTKSFNLNNIKGLKDLSGKSMKGLKSFSKGLLKKFGGPAGAANYGMKLLKDLSKAKNINDLKSLSNRIIKQLDGIKGFKEILKKVKPDPGKE